MGRMEFCSKCSMEFPVNEGAIAEGETTVHCPICKEAYEVHTGPATPWESQAEAPAEAAPTEAAPAEAAPFETPPAPAEAAPAEAAPFETPPAPVEVPPVPAEPTPVEAAPPTVKTPGTDVTVLVANTDPAVCDTVEEILSTVKMTVIKKHDGVDALAAIESERPQVAIVDVSLPRLYGFEVCQQVKDDDKLKDIKVILMASVYDERRYKRRPASLYGADDYLEKHHIHDMLIDKIGRLLAGEAPLRDVSLSPGATTPRAAAPAKPVHEPVPGPAPAQEGPAPAQEPPAPAEPALVTPAPTEPSEVPPEVPAEEPPFAPQIGSTQAPPPPPAGAAAPTETTGVGGAVYKEDRFADRLREAEKPIEANDPEAEQSARKLARIIVSDIILYNSEEVEEGLRDGNLFSLLEDDIKDGLTYIRKRVPPGLPAEQYFKEAMQDFVNKRKRQIRGG